MKPRPYLSEPKCVPHPHLFFFLHPREMRVATCMMEKLDMARKNRNVGESAWNWTDPWRYRCTRAAVECQYSRSTWWQYLPSFLADHIEQ